jgi:hypothetical protein
MAVPPPQIIQRKQGGGPFPVYLTLMRFRKAAN